MEEGVVQDRQDRWRDDLLDEAEEVLDRAKVWLTRAERNGDGRLALQAMDRVDRSIERIARLREGPERTVNIFMLPQFTAFQDAIYGLLPPDLRPEFAQRLLALESGNHGPRG